MKKFMKWFMGLFYQKCPDCGCKMKSEGIHYYSTDIFSIYYKCTGCQKEWI